MLSQREEQKKGNVVLYTGGDIFEDDRYHCERS